MKAERDVPQRELRNDIARILKEVAAGARIRVTVRGRPVAELVPVTPRRSFVPREEIARILRDAPLDPGFEADVASVLSATIDDL